ncbi:hypothetical protein NADFUDRAFT_51712 [Nadsonia fulvescens var. elongata DSM 6958]|uniref:DUF2415 domain-containing protein n=1 Tax=Nadsonia fulvescens var. elongata DSM 6958 TaxID=857566 RepID=A0A1E3PI74_9ASCO|nr:hypothetical protein NADFUDRAFT_51712 [Nadsonia fulvescens var. elongata DSM 6958]
MVFDPLVSSHGILHPTNVTIKHWQLRDLLVSRQGPNVTDAASLYPHNATVRQLNFTTGRDTLVVNLDFEPRCLVSYGEVLVAGGVRTETPTSVQSVNSHSEFINNRNSHRRQSSMLSPPPFPPPWSNSFRSNILGNTPPILDEGILSVANISTGEKYSGPPSVGGLINNSVSLYSRGQRALACNNDNSIYMLSINPAEYSVCEKINFEFPLNHAAISPIHGSSEGHQTLAVVGDSPDIHFLNQTSRGWQTTSLIPTDSDYVLSTGFHDNGVLFAVASQNGKARIYDQRKLSNYASGSTPLYQISTTRPKLAAGCFRTLKFGKAAEDLLFVSEHNNRVHMLDIRNFENHQVLEVNGTSVHENQEPRNGFSTGHIPRHSNYFEDDKSEFTHTEYSLPPWQSFSDDVISTPTVYTIRGTVTPFKDVSPYPSNEPVPQNYRYNTQYTYQASVINGENRDEGAVDYHTYTDSTHNSDDDIASHRTSLGDNFPRSINSQRWQIMESSIPSSQFSQQQLPLRRRRGYQHIGSTVSESGWGNENNQRPISFRIPDYDSSRSLPYTSSRYSTARANTDINGLAWSSYHGGSLLVGCEKGIGVWPIDVRSRKVWQRFQLR